MNSLDKQYLTLLDRLLTRGRKKGDRTGTGTLSIFDYTIDHDMSEGFPLLTTKRVWFKGVLHELLWFLQGNTNIEYLVKNGVHIWDAWPHKVYAKKCEAANIRPMDVEQFAIAVANNPEFAAAYGDVGKVYGAQWTKWTDTTVKSDINSSLREYRELNQINNLINTLNVNPDDRRMIVTAWNPAEVKNVALPPCHYGFQCYSEVMTMEERMAYRMRVGMPYLSGEGMSDEDIMNYMDKEGTPVRRLSLKWLIRSVDTFLGMPFDIASYGTLLELLGRVTNHAPHRLIMSSGDTHLYLNHIEQAKLQLKNGGHDLPKLQIKNPLTKDGHKPTIYDYSYEDFLLTDYKHDGNIKGDISV